MGLGLIAKGVTLNNALSITLEVGSFLEPFPTRPRLLHFKCLVLALADPGQNDSSDISKFWSNNREYRGMLCSHLRKRKFSSSSKMYPTERAAVTLILGLTTTTVTTWVGDVPCDGTAWESLPTWTYSANAKQCNARARARGR